jgi:hypothetical protein
MWYVTQSKEQLLVLVDDEIDDEAAEGDAGNLIPWGFSMAPPTHTTISNASNQGRCWGRVSLLTVPSSLRNAADRVSPDACDAESSMTGTTSSRGWESVYTLGRNIIVHGGLAAVARLRWSASTSSGTFPAACPPTTLCVAWCGRLSGIITGLSSSTSYNCCCCCCSSISGWRQTSRPRPLGSGWIDDPSNGRDTVQDASCFHVLVALPNVEVAAVAAAEPSLPSCVGWSAVEGLPSTIAAAAG